MTTQYILLLLFAVYVRLNIITRVKFYRFELQLKQREPDNYLDFLSKYLEIVSIVIPLLSVTLLKMFL